MSEQTRTDLEKAIRAHLVDGESDAFLVSWVCVLEYATIKDSEAAMTPIQIQTKEDQSWVISRGLLESGADYFRRVVLR